MRGYRGKRFDTGEWVNGSLSMEYFKECGCVMISPTPYLCHKVDPETVGECTGIMGDFFQGEPKAGGIILRSFIYEGDIVEPVLLDGTHKGFSWGKQVVVFDKGAFCLKDRRGQITPMCNYAESVQFRVRGNVWDNPELLEGQSDA